MAPPVAETPYGPADPPPPPPSGPYLSSTDELKTLRYDLSVSVDFTPMLLNK